MANKICPVSFNLDDPDQLAMYQHAKTRASFSGYVKRLIQRDMEGGTFTPVRQEKPAVSVLGALDVNQFI